ncbi:MAG TPA: acyltransferase, partial [Pseudomonadales bacterium]|nr:acyltransferase [Pseudomonadales bacterium]
LLQGGLEVLITHGQTSVIDILQLWHPHGQLWFLPILFACFLLMTPVTAKLKWPYFLLIWLGLLIWYLQKDSGLPDAFPFESFAGNAVYFASGILFNRIQGSVWRNKTVIFAISLPVFLLAQWLFHFEFNLVYATPHRWAAFGLALISVCCVVSGCMVLAGRNLRWLEFIGRHSLEIYLMHYIAATLARVVLVRFLHVELASVYISLVFLAAMIGPLLAAVVIERVGLGFLLMPPKSFRLERWAASGQ